MTQTNIPELLLDRKACYAAMQAHDVRFDGRFFCGVSSTGIYCRPICRVKLPKEENCTFFISAAAAEAAGYRPCLRCRPELAPGMAPIDSAARLARSAALIMAEDCWNTHKISDLAAMLNITDRHLRRVFLAEFGVSPSRYFKTQKLLLAKSLLTDTRLAVTDVALAAGFGSIRRFNELFKKYYHLAPSELRMKAARMGRNKDGITLFLGYRPPYAWDSLLSFLASRALPGVESVAQDAYRRTVAIPKSGTIYYGWIVVENRPKLNALSVTISAGLLPVLSQVLARIRFLFDLNCSPDKVYEKLVIMNEIVANIYVPGIRVPGCFDPFEMSVRAILGQQITVKAASTLAARLATAFGNKLDTPFPELQFTFPQPERFCSLERPVENYLGPLGITKVRARSIAALASAVVAKSLTLSSSAGPKDVMEKLLEVPGLGPWTVQYIALRALGWPDAFPHTDYGVKKVLANRSPQEILNLSRDWSPWRSYATILLWNFLAQKFADKKDGS
ncbi:DNA-3-methyladenine glycosylase 2 family protein [Sporomusa acidovorans]|uniref:DNA-3-methyladenine glycosylase II n=1 Tax=Sporomusa acidovorans (strain ATCC 49682 / DSM 3132 / Mol) TaxID=1123286 RepID=A0ABZ3J2T8_SPOA4|nr:AlkA N-terminal domain-containing protein [Sporomusa acidovorans]OZC24101.1 DNA-3-methyladenine glycosylase 2 [Sporomusa acidovorans DSM 3132]SDF69054.1 DNA-3-methyladenine glycosylase II [Sporomusa acidovorans]